MSSTPDAPGPRAASPAPDTHGTSPEPRAAGNLPDPGPTPSPRVPLLDVPGVVAWLRRDGIEPVLARLVTALEEDWSRWDRVEKSPRIASHTAIGVIELMPVSDGEHFAFKYVNGHPGNPARGLQTVTAFGAYADVATGYPLLLAEMTLLTALRTAAMSALAAREMARPGARVHAMIGAGSQAAFQALALRAVLGLDQVRAFDLDPAAVEALRGHLAPRGLSVHAAGSVEEALEGADVVTTCTAAKARQAVLRPEHLRPGLHLNAIGGDCPGKTELDPGVLTAVDRIVVEFAPQTRIEGEIQQLPAEHPVTELAEVLDGRAIGRGGPEEVTLFDSVGFALADFSVLRLAHAATAGTDLVTPVQLVADPPDPRDLFALLEGP